MVVDVEKRKLWFRAKRYGYGWFPITWQGWGVVLMYVFSVVTDGVYVNNHIHSVSDTFSNFFPRLFILTIFLIIICEAKGEPARWRWGKKDQIDRNEDFR